MNKWVIGLYFIKKDVVFESYEVDGKEIVMFPGFFMTTKKGLVINKQTVFNLKVINMKLSCPLVLKKVMNQYNKLILLLTELLVSDDGTGDSYKEVLNQIEKFRLEIKNKYRLYLKQKELEVMSKQLMTLKKEAINRLIELSSSYFMRQSNGKSR